MSAWPSALTDNTYVGSRCEAAEGGTPSSFTCDDSPSSPPRCASEGSGVNDTGETRDHFDEPSLSPVLTVDELANYLRLNHKTVREAIDRREIPGVRFIGTTIRISRDAVLAWLSSGQGRVSRSKRFR